MKATDLGNTSSRSGVLPLRMQAGRIVTTQAIDSRLEDDVLNVSERAAAAQHGQPIERAVLKVLLPSIAALAALLLHRCLPSKQSSFPTHAYPLVLEWVFAITLLAAAAAWPAAALRRWLRPKAPLAAVMILLVAAWDLITLKLALLPLPHFPGPDMVLQSLSEDWRELLDCTLHSLLLLLSGYAAGVVLGIIWGVLIGWSPRVRYWGIPVLKILGPMPATAWIPLAMVVSPGSYPAAVAIIALAVWFPVTMLTISGVSNVRMSYLDVARTLGAGRGYLIFRVAIPAAMPSIFIGLFMGLGASFLTLVVAEGIGVSSGLGWYADKARSGMEYSRIYASLAITAVFFSIIMTLLFKVRDRVLVWQKGVIKW